jgi:hypothetical protein
MKRLILIKSISTCNMGTIAAGDTHVCTRKIMPGKVSH